MLASTLACAGRTCNIMWDDTGLLIARRRSAGRHGTHLHLQVLACCVLTPRGAVCSSRRTSVAAASGLPCTAGSCRSPGTGQPAPAVPMAAAATCACIY